MKMEAQLVNYEAWLNGLYIRQAIASVFSKNAKYPEQPFDNSSERNSSMDEEAFQKQFEAWAIIHNSNLKK